tara:strand:+ start:1246 stop:2688 length:1443 start_codon:yes stop_codon:yes gene_type:complete
MTLLIRGGTVVNADDTKRADVYCVDGKITAVGEDLEVPASTKIIDASGALVIPGGIDPHTHMELPFMGTVTSDDFFTGPSAGLAGGTTMIIDFVIPDPDVRPMDAWKVWTDNAKKAPSDYSFHVAITNWNEQVEEDMGILTREHGVNSFKHFMAYKGAIMLDDEKLLRSFARCQELGALCTVHAENGDLVWMLQREMLKQGITGPEGHVQSRPPEVEGEAANRAIRIAQVLNAPIYIVHVSCKDALEPIMRARRDGQRVYGECLVQHLVVDDSVHYLKDAQAARAHVMSPPFRSKEHHAALWEGIQAGFLQTTASDHCCFCADQKAMGAEDFTKIPNGTGAIEDRMSVFWDQGVETGKLTANEFVALTSAQAAQIFNIYPRKGSIRVGSDADIVIWDPDASRTISVKTHHQNIDHNIYEGMKVKGVAAKTISQGRLVWDGQELMVNKGAGRFIERPTFPPVFGAVERARNLKIPRSVSRP